MNGGSHHFRLTEKEEEEEEVWWIFSKALSPAYCRISAGKNASFRLREASFTLDMIVWKYLPGHGLCRTRRPSLIEILKECRILVTSSTKAQQEDGI